MNILDIAKETGAEIILGKEQDGWENPVYDLEPEVVFTYTQLTKFAELLDKAEVSEPIGEMKENGVTWFKQNPHAYPVGTKLYTTPQPSRIAELEAEIARLKGGNTITSQPVQAALWTAEDEKRMDIIGQNSNEGLHYDSE